MIKHKFLLLSGLVFSSQLFAFQCYFTLVKDSCWTDYSVTVNVMDVANNSTAVTVTAPKGQSWARQGFTCQPGQEFLYKATFEPYIWSSEKGEVYTAINYWTLPKAPKPGESAWEIPVCYPQAFSAVPLPPQATNNCACDFSKVPAIPPKKLD
ncbi:periplasmic protein [Legionella beliardensis]|uniref:Periplasmic protein n=1 Tax=Legionella beliardensis TaxID=91822 RepID=A0A378I1Q8_9GAMM|nr:hypothetical protein [Legionella beliardensis]STX28651.1 periplasmic protein [Legionella beliardensis]